MVYNILFNLFQSILFHKNFIYIFKKYQFRYYYQNSSNSIHLYIEIKCREYNKVFILYYDKHYTNQLV